MVSEGRLEALRVVARLRAAEGDIAAAERALREVIQRAETHCQPQLYAEATRDLATVLTKRPGRRRSTTLTRSIA